MKIRKINIITYSACVLLGFISCKKGFLEADPTEQIEKKDVFTSLEKIQVAMTGIYDLTTTASNTTAYTHNMILNSDVKGGDVLIVSTGNFSRFTNGYQFIETPNSYEPSTYWSTSYQIIANTNEFVDKIPSAPISDSQKLRFLAEARALRAEAYFWLVRWYGKPYSLDPEALGVPIISKPLGQYETPPGRSKVKDVYNFILEDLLFAELNIGTDRTNIYRMNVPAIQGFLARVYLTMENWTEAVKYAKLARANKPLSSADDLLKGFINPTTEWIYAMNVRADDNQGLLGVHSFYDPYDVGYSTFRATEEFFNSFSASDLRKRQFLVKSGVNANQSTAQYRKKGEGYLINKFDYNTTSARNLVLIRSSEMWLIEAEAEARQGASHEPAARLALYEIQKRADPTKVLSTNTGSSLINEIMEERAKELYGEGHKFFDLLRTKTPITRAGSLSHWAPVNFQPGNKKLVLPIPQNEINANPGIEPNPL